MSTYRHTRSLLSLDSPSTHPQLGAAYLVLSSDGDRTEDAQQRYALFAFTRTEEPDGALADPSVLVGLESSPDGQHWVPLTVHPATKSGVTPDGLYPLDAIGPYVRAKTTLIGEASPSHTAHLVLASNAPFRLKRTP